LERAPGLQAAKPTAARRDSHTDFFIEAIYVIVFTSRKPQEDLAYDYSLVKGKF